MLTAGVLAVAAPASAQETTELPAIVVEGATLEAPPAKPKNKAVTNAGSKGQPETAAEASTGEGEGQTTGSVNGVPAEEVGSAVTVVTGEQLRAQQIRHAADALRSLPGVDVSRTGSDAGLTQVRIRGAEANHTLVLIDGIQANDTTNGEFNFSDLAAEDIEQVEVIRGPQSGLYGSGAVGGVVNIITKGGRGPLTFSGYGEGGSFNTFNRGARVSGGTDKFWGSASVETLRTDGFNISPVGSENDGAKLTTLSLRAGAEILPRTILELTLRHTEKQGDRDTQDPFPSVSGIQVDDPATFNERTWLGAAKLTWNSLDGAFTQVARATRNETDRSDNNNQAPLFVTDNLGERATYGYLPTYRFVTPEMFSARHSVTGLVEYERELFTSNTFSDDPFFGFPPDSAQHERTRLSYAAEYFVEFGGRLSVTANVRHDDNDTMQDFTTWRTASSLQLTDLGIRPHASVGTAVKFPSMFELFGTIPGLFTPNPALLPEESFGWDSGVEFTVIPKTFLVDVTYFDADLKNKITGFFTPVNLLGMSQHKGVEVGARWLVTRSLGLGASYTYLSALDPDGIQEIRRPRNTGRADLNYRFDGDRGNFNVAAIYNGDMTDTNFGPFPSETVTLSNYWLVNVAASYKIAPGTELIGRVQNLLNQDYQEIYGFETAGIAAYAGLKFSYEEPLVDNK